MSSNFLLRDATNFFPVRFQMIVGQVELHHQMQHLFGQRRTDIDELGGGGSPAVLF